MKLSLQDKVALMFTAASSQRELARSLGITHQKAGRLLRIGQPNGYSENSKVIQDFFLNEVVDIAFNDHIEKARFVARQHDLPFTKQLPVYAQRMPHKDGIPGDRVQAINLDYLSDRLKTKWIAAQHPSGKYVNVSVGSIVNLTDYNRLASALNKGKISQDQIASKLSILATLAAETNVDFGLKKPDDFDDWPAEDQQEWRAASTAHMLKSEKKVMRELGERSILSRIQTKYTRFDKSFPVDMILDDVISKLNQKHAPAVGDAGTVFADRVLFQVETRNDKDKKYRDKHPFQKSKPGQTRRAKSRAKRR